jgi:hypothetical protein
MTIILDYIKANIPQLLTAVLALGAVKVYASAILKVVNESNELITVVLIALADGKITQEELKAIYNEADDIPTAVKELVSLFKKK